jgi:GDP-4-dehydro-6-deoxy-D-mannose reductase
MSVLITGGNGFVARHLAHHILQGGSGAEVFATFRPGHMPERGDRIHPVEMDLTDADSVAHALKEVEADRIFHLAAMSSVSGSWAAPNLLYRTNVEGTLNLLEGVRRMSRGSPFILLAGSSEEYGPVAESDLPISEGVPLHPISPYAVSKVAASMMGHQYAAVYGLNILRTRTFNLTGPGRGDSFADSSFAKQIALIEKGEKEPVIEHGNLAAVRDFTDVRDAARAYWLLSERKWRGDVLNVCSGKGRTLAEALSLLVSMSARKNVTTCPVPSRMRPSDIPCSIGSNTKLRSFIDWTPQIPYEESVKGLLEYWRERV